MQRDGSRASFPVGMEHENRPHASEGKNRMFRKIVASLLVLVLVIGVMPQTIFLGEKVAAHAQGKEVPSGYIGIYTAEDLNRVRENLSGSYILMNDIDLSKATAAGGAYDNNGAGWMPIGNVSTPFTGIFNGNGHKIIGLKLSMKSEHFIYAGLFGLVANAKIENLGMVNNQIVAENTSLSAGSSDVYAGGIVGYGTNVSITNSYHTGTVTANSMFKGYAGEIAGYVKSAYNTFSMISGSYNTGEVFAKTSAGGIVGEAYRTNISNVYNAGSFVDQTSSYTGGIVGYLQSHSSITNAYSTGNLQINSVGGGIAGATLGSSTIGISYNKGELSSSSKYSRIGGIVGSASGSTVISKSYNEGKISSSASSSTGGGIAGYMYGNSSITESYNTADISMGSSSGGIIGDMSNTVISTSFNTGNMTGTYAGGISAWSIDGIIVDSFNIGKIDARYDAGGVVGHASSSTIKNTYNIGEVDRTYSVGSLGGIAGEFTGTIQNSYFINNLHGVGDGSSDGSYQKTMEQMKQQSTFSGFDFSSKWKLSTTSGYRFPTNGVTPGEDTEREIAVKMASYPTKTNYLQGEKLDVYGGTLEVLTNHGNQVVVPISDSLVGAYVLDTPGEQTVDIYYGDLYTSFRVYAIPVYTVTFKSDDGQVLKTEQVVEGASATPPTPPVRAGSTFTGWNGSFEKVKNNQVITAQYEVNTYNVTHMDGDKVIYSERYEGEHTLYRPGSPTKAGYTFLDWYQDRDLQTKYMFDHPITNDVILYAKFMKNPTAPSGMKVVSVGFNKLKLTWNAVSGVDGYEVQRATSANGDYNYIYQLDAKNTTLIVDDLEPGKTYYFKIKAIKNLEGQTIDGSFSNVVSGKSVLAGVTSVKAASAGFDKVKISWAKSSDASGYEIYRATSSVGTYSKVGTVTSGSTVSFTNSGIATGKTYYYKVRAYRNVDGKKVYSSYSSVVSGKAALSVVGSVKATSAGYSKSKLSWSKTAGANGYVIYRSTSKTGTYSKVGTVTNGSTVTYTNAGLTSGKTYYYKIKAYRTVSGTNVNGPLSSVVSVKPVLAKPASLALSKPTSTSIKTTWGKVSEASGYEVYRATSSTGTYSKVATISKSSTVTYTNKSLKKGKTYYYKVRAYRVVNGKKIYSSYSVVKSVKL